eukprot:TRINITY_DN13423_c0_g1_i1.p1 TRINITY_DN13423_c0_g1~~TRINITY_DN13423_c0_g1_i1.p1  ORF type:complete len:372 (-),score=17.00 TRINITY_DN13423_c0_g1_i1:501-1616(-)
MGSCSLLVTVKYQQLIVGVVSVEVAADEPVSIVKAILTAQEGVPMSAQHIILTVWNSPNGLPASSCNTDDRPIGDCVPTTADVSISAILGRVVCRVVPPCDLAIPVAPPSMFPSDQDHFFLAIDVSSAMLRPFIAQGAPSFATHHSQRHPESQRIPWSGGRLQVVYRAICGVLDALAHRPRPAFVQVSVYAADVTVLLRDWTSTHDERPSSLKPLKHGLNDGQGEEMAEPAGGEGVPPAPNGIGREAVVVPPASRASLVERVMRRLRRCAVGGSANVKAALATAFADHATDAVVLISDSQPAGSTSDTLRVLRKWTVRRPIPVHTVGFVSPFSHAGAERFLSEASAVTGGLYRGVLGSPAAAAAGLSHDLP